MNKEWFIFKNTHHLGPFTVEEIEAFFRAGEINGNTLIWKEGIEKWEQLSRIDTFDYLFTADEKKSAMNRSNASKPTRLPKLPEVNEDLSNDLPPPIPLDAIIDPKGQIQKRIKNDELGLRYSKYGLIFAAVLFSFILGRYVLLQQDSAISLRIKGLMPIYLEKLEMTATKNSPHLEVALTLSLDASTIWGSTNFGGKVSSDLFLNSIPGRVLGTKEVAIHLNGDFINHVAKFNKMTLINGEKFVPGEYKFHVVSKSIHFLNRTFSSLEKIEFFKKFNKSFVYDGVALIYSGTPREFEKKIHDFTTIIETEQLKPLQDKLESMQTFESIINSTSQNYLMELETTKSGKGISAFETKFTNEISPLLQSLMTKAIEATSNPLFSEEKMGANSIATYKEQILIGKQIGELASDMITKTEKYKLLTDDNKRLLRKEFDIRIHSIKSQIDLTIKNLEEQLKKTMKNP